MENTGLDIITMKGITRKGKNRIKQFGTQWRVIMEKNHKLLIEPVYEPDGYRQDLRWVLRSNDPDFDIVGIIPDMT